MKILVVGDLHGKDCWKEINCKKYDKVIFIGDYVDSFTLSDIDILENLKAIIKYRKKTRDKVILLLGNHDIQYMYYPNFTCSGFRKSMLKELSELFLKNRDEFQVAWQYENYLFTHAGVTKSWYEEFLTSPYFNKIDSKIDSLAGLLNAADKITPLANMIYHAGSSRGGKGNGGVVWADKRELASGLISGFHQIVGHTPSINIETISYGDSTSATFVDVLDKKIEFYELEITEPKS